MFQLSGNLMSVPLSQASRYKDAVEHLNDVLFCSKIDMAVYVCALPEQDGFLLFRSSFGCRLESVRQGLLCRLIAQTRVASVVRCASFVLRS